MNARAVIASVSLAALLSGCATLPEVLPTIHPEDTHRTGWVESRALPPAGTVTVEVTTTAGQTVKLKRPYLSDDQYSGWAIRKGRRTLVGIPVDSIAGYRYVQFARRDDPCNAGTTEEIACGVVEVFFGILVPVARGFHVSPVGGK